MLTSAEPTGDAELDAALAGIAEWASPPRPDEWVARPRLRIHGGYLERLAAAGVVRAQSRFSARRWHVSDGSRLAEARQRLDLIAGSAGAVDLEQAAYAGLACVIDLDRRLYRGRARSAERDRLREVAGARRAASREAAGDPAADPGGLPPWDGGWARGCSPRSARAERRRPRCLGPRSAATLGSRDAKQEWSTRVTGQTYLERGQPVVVLIRWETRPPAAGSVIWHRSPRRIGPRNVLIERGDGSLVVRPFRGLRTPPAAPLPPRRAQRDR